MKSPELFRFNNNTSVRFNVASFALPVATTRKKNSIYAALTSQVKGTNGKLLPADPPVETHGYKYAAYWNNSVFCADETGIYVADKNILQFEIVSQLVNPHKLCVANDRLFAISLNRKRVIYSQKLTDEWVKNNMLVGAVFIPDSYGLCLDIVLYHNNLLAICENGLLTINKSLALTHIADDSQILIDNLTQSIVPFWESAWFTLGYATDTQSLREVFLKTNTSLILLVESNRMKRTIRVKAAKRVQKVKTNLPGDQFKLTLVLPSGDFCIADLSAVVQYGKRG